MVVGYESRLTIAIDYTFGTVIVSLISLLVLRTLHLDKHWEIAIVRDNAIWLGRADGTQMRCLIKNADTPRWSPNGGKLAYARGEEIWIHDFNKQTNRRIARFPKLKQDERKYIEWDPKLPILLTATDTSETIVLVGLDVVFTQNEIFAGTIHAPTNAMRWAPSGLAMAYAHGGDVWLAHREADQLKSDQAIAKRDGLFGNGYYHYAQRLAPLASFNDGELGASAGTPFWVTQLAWTKSGKRLAFGYSRIGGSGVAEVGYLDLVKAPADWSNNHSGYQVRTQWIWKDVILPRICPDGFTLSFVKLPWGDKEDRYWLCLGAWDGKSKLRLIPDVIDYDWRPLRRR